MRGKTAPIDERSFETQPARSSRDVLAFYDAYAPSWDERFGDSPVNQHFHRERLGSLLDLARFQPGDRAVELGVGTGPYLETIARRVRTLLCIDGSSRMLEELTRKHAHLGNVQVMERDLEQPFDPTGDGVDIVYWFGLLEHIIDVQTFVAGCRRMLNPGGRLVLVGPNGRCPWYGSLRRIVRAGAHCSTDHYYTVEECDALMAPHGLARTGLVYWGYAPAGIPRAVYTCLTVIGRALDKTPLRQFAGGMTVRYDVVGPGRPASDPARR